jgi:hypothetical protein
MKEKWKDLATLPDRLIKTGMTIRAKSVGRNEGHDMLFNYTPEMIEQYSGQLGVIKALQVTSGGHIRIIPDFDFWSYMWSKYMFEYLDFSYKTIKEVYDELCIEERNNLQKIEKDETT